ncbi:HET-domain-containing protein, partial [Corynespora cassiicola Philippines]
FSGRIVGATVDFGLLRLWLDMCRKWHFFLNVRSPNGLTASREQCCSAPSQPTIPHFRLIDVVEQCAIAPQPLAQYAALSYVWGTARRLLLCVDNLAQYSTPGALCMNNPGIPTTFKDAFVVATELDIQYIWIDAPCILQNNEEYMRRMDSIYSSAVVTIVSDTDDADSGIPGISVPRGPSQATFRYDNTPYISSKRIFGKSMVDSIWETRAWCFQEKLFSKRLLIFSPSQAFYYCQRASYSEDLILETNSGIKRDESTRSEPRPWYSIRNSHLPDSMHDLRLLIESYSKRQLSFEIDTIRAFQGVFNFVEVHTGPTIWGIPRLWFKEMMMWHMYYNPKLRRAQFPSWSWAGWRGNIRYQTVLPYMLSYDDPPDNGDMWPIDWMCH